MPVTGIGAGEGDGEVEGDHIVPNAAGRRKAPRRQGCAAEARSQRSNPRAIEATLADLAHDIRTPLTGILALGELLATSELGERERGWAAAIKTTAEHLALLTSLIVDAARAAVQGSRAAARTGPAAPAGRGGGGDARRRAPRPRPDAASEIAADLPDAVIGDPLRLRAALENLIDNAVKFTERGSVRFEAACESGARAAACGSSSR